MTERGALIEAFLKGAGWVGAARRTIAGDASFRRYERLAFDGRTVILMDAPPPHEDVRPFTTIARHLASLGFSAPTIYAADERAGLLLIEDFGDANVAPLVDGSADKVAHYALAVDTLIALHKHPQALQVTVPRFEEARLVVQGFDLLLDWYLPVVTGEPVPRALRDEYLALWGELMALTRRVPDALVLFDYFPENLMLLEGRHGIAACGLLDFQDAVIGPLTHDLVSILRDARRDVPADLENAMLARYLAAFPTLDRADFAAAYAAIGAYRNLRIIGTFTRLCVRDGKPSYLRHIPRLWRLVEENVAHPALAPLEIWLDRHVPRELRCIPRCEAAE
jgi:aminoglycoside/choline kinase family phosphotransferase